MFPGKINRDFNDWRRARVRSQSPRLTPPTGSIIIRGNYSDRKLNEGVTVR
jgi:hypothetical protein